MGLPLHLDVLKIDDGSMDAVLDAVRNIGDEIDRLKNIMDILPQNLLDYGRLKIILAILEYEYGTERREGAPRQLDTGSTQSGPSRAQSSATRGGRGGGRYSNGGRGGGRSQTNTFPKKTFKPKRRFIAIINMSKNQRRKGNAQTASSSRAAELLQSSGIPLPALLGLDTSSVDIPDAFADEFGPNVDPEFRIALKKLSKRDSFTREKAVKELADLLNNSNYEQTKNSFSAFASSYSKLVT
uniref:E3 ubiquitin-protein ligase listerin n=1 Tax=Acrobeloides nanus TaxID=290746 RepID=A0A914D5J1_9BILA